MSESHGIAARLRGGGGGSGGSGDTLARPIGKRSLEDVVFSLRIMSSRIRHYDLAGPHKADDLAIARRVTDRLLGEYASLGGKMSTRSQVGLYGGPDPDDGDLGRFRR